MYVTELRFGIVSKEIEAKVRVITDMKKLRVFRNQTMVLVLLLQFLPYTIFSLSGLLS